MRHAFLLAILGMVATPLSALAGPTVPLQAKVKDIAHDQPIPEKFALCQPDGHGKSKGGENLRPTISWGHAPDDTRAFAIVVTDPDVPADFTDAGKDGKVVKADAKRQIFYHWALADIPANISEIPGGPSRNAPEVGVAAKGSLEKYVDNPTQYGGPCPPWNDERVHHYHFTIYALSVPTLGLSGNVTAAAVEAAAKKHALASATVTGTYTLNAAMRK